MQEAVSSASANNVYVHVRCVAESKLAENKLAAQTSRFRHCSSVLLGQKSAIVHLHICTFLAQCELQATAAFLLSSRSQMRSDQTGCRWKDKAYQDDFKERPAVVAAES